MEKQIAEEIFISGYARLPSDITANKLYEVVAVGLLIKSNTGKIKEAEFTLATSVSRNFLSKLFEGKNINNIDELLHIIEISYFGAAQKALKTALLNCKKKYDSLNQ